MTICCPKCASNEGRSIESIYKTPENERPAMAPALSRQSEPPEARHPGFWLALTVAFALATIASFSFGSTAAALAVCAALSAAMTREAMTYNRRYLPQLIEYWHRAVICTTCGEVFVPG